MTSGCSMTTTTCRFPFRASSIPAMQRTARLASLDPDDGIDL